MDHARLERILRCPISRQRLVWVGPDRLAQLNAQLARGELHGLDGSRVREPLQAAFSTADGELVYRVQDEIVVLLAGLALTARPATAERTRLSVEKQNMMAFYDQVGWVDHGNLFEDAERFEDLRPVARDYIHNCHLRLKQHLPARGTYLLDAACGPIQYPEYLTYSEGYAYRICVDLSIVALRRARQKLGARGIYLLCDVTNLPLQDECVQGFVSLHTIYHVPANEQLQGISELYRALQPGGSGVIVYSWGEHAAVFHPRRLAGQRARALLRAVLPSAVHDGLKRVLKRGRYAHVVDDAASAAAPASEPPLYFSAHDFVWFREQLAPRFNAELAPWRSLSVPASKRFVHARYGGRQALAWLFALESRFPHFFGRHGQYPAFILRR
jgi:SAM-dependent methyltransferase